MKKEIEYSFLHNYPGRNIKDFMDRQERNKTLRAAGVLVTIECLDVLISLRTLRPAERTFSGIFDDMVTLTPPEGQIVLDRDQIEEAARKKLSLLLGYLSRKKMIKKVENKEARYKITKLGKTMMKKAKEALGY